MAKVYLIIYDFCKYNCLFHFLGIGMYHTTVQINNSEISFGSTYNLDTGVYTEIVSSEDLHGSSSRVLRNLSLVNHREDDTEGKEQEEDEAARNFNQENYYFREKIYLGETELSEEEIQSKLDDLKQEYLGITYDIFSKNCNNFSQDLCL